MDNDESRPSKHNFGLNWKLTPEQTLALVRLAVELDPDLAYLLPILEEQGHRGEGAAKADSVEEE